MAGSVAQVFGADPATDLVCTGCVQATDLATNAVTAAKLRADSVTGAKILDGSVAAADLAADSVDASKITDGSVTLGDLATDSVDTSKIKNAAVGLADLASNSVDSTKIKNGSIAEADLNATLLARLAKMEADIAALKGGPYSNATFKGTYRCQALGVSELGKAEPDASYAGVNFDSGTVLITADGAGSATYDGTWTAFERGWYVAFHTTPTDWYNYLGGWENVTLDQPDEPQTFAYSVSADGSVDTGSQDDAFVISLNGDVLIGKWLSPTYPQGDESLPRHGYAAGQHICVRTVRP
jgi:hypothetical protein